MYHTIVNTCTPYRTCTVMKGNGHTFYSHCLEWCVGFVNYYYKRRTSIYCIYASLPSTTTITMSSSALDFRMMRLALIEARKCTPRAGAFSVGCVIALNNEAQPEKAIVLASSYSRDLEGNTHAEANALEKIRTIEKEKIRGLLLEAGMESVSIENVLRSSTVYTTMEPCSVRTSGLAPCADALINVGVKKVVIGVGEPDDFVHCEGAQKLKEAGIEVVWLKGIEKECLEVARQS